MIIRTSEKELNHIERAQRSVRESLGFVESIASPDASEVERLINAALVKLEIIRAHQAETLDAEEINA